MVFAVTGWNLSGRVCQLVEKRLSA
jgi:hypothetical protein